MDQLTILKAQIDLNALMTSLKLSIEEVERKKPDSDYISAMKKHLDNMLDVNYVLREFENEVKRMSVIIGKYHKETMDLKFENEKLKNQVTELMNGI